MGWAASTAVVGPHVKVNCLPAVVERAHCVSVYVFSALRVCTWIIFLQLLSLFFSEQTLSCFSSVVCPASGTSVYIFSSKNV